MDDDHGCANCQPARLSDFNPGVGRWIDPDAIARALDVMRTRSTEENDVDCQPKCICSKPQLDSGQHVPVCQLPSWYLRNSHLFAGPKPRVVADDRYTP